LNNELLPFLFLFFWQEKTNATSHPTLQYHFITIQTLHTTDTHLELKEEVIWGVVVQLIVHQVFLWLHRNGPPAYTLQSLDRNPEVLFLGGKKTKTVHFDT